jgi:hypothetical protein
MKLAQKMLFYVLFSGYKILGKKGKKLLIFHTKNVGGGVKN